MKKQICLLMSIAILGTSIAMPASASVVSENDISEAVVTMGDNTIDDIYPLMPAISKEEYNRQIRQVATEFQPGIHEDSEISAETASAFPAKYDARDYGLVTSVKDQWPYGLCWTYAAIAACESNLIKKGYENNTVDLSEFYSSYFNMFGRNYTDYKDFANMGGNAYEIFDDMKNGIGPMYEKDYPMPKVITEDTQIAASENNKHLYQARNMYFTTMNTDSESMNKVKELILTYGGACFEYWADFYKQKINGTCSYYCPYDINDVNHEVELIGWDDNYSKNNFMYTPPADGAWLIKNSAGVYSGDDGYVWISYWDRTIDGTDVVAVDMVRNGMVPDRVTLNKTEITLNEGEEFQLSASVLPQTAENKAVEWEVSPRYYASVDETGKITAEEKGTCEVICRTVEGGGEAKCTVNIKRPIGKIIAKDVTMKIGTSVDKLPAFSPEEPSDPSYEMTSNNPDIVSITNNKTLTALKEGEASVTVKALDGSGAVTTFKVTVTTNKLTGIHYGGDTKEIVTSFIEGTKTLKQKGFVFNLDCDNVDATAGVKAEISNTEKFTYTYKVSESRFEKNSFYVNVQLDLVDVDSYVYEKSDYTYIRVYSEDGRFEDSIKVTVNSWYPDGYVSQTPSPQPVEPTIEPTPTPTVIPTPSEAITVVETPAPVETDIVEPVPTTEPNENQASTCAHTYVETKKAATKYAAGYIQKSCNICGNIASKKVIPQLGFVLVEAEDHIYDGKCHKASIDVYDVNNNKIDSNNYKVTYMDAKNVGTASICVKGINDYSFIKYYQYKILPKQTEICKLSVKAGKLVVKWKKQTKQTSGYEIVYSTSKKFAGKNTKTVKISSNKTTSKQINGLKSGKKYYFKVRTYKKVGNKKYYSDWSKVKNITLK